MSHLAWEDKLSGGGGTRCALAHGAGVIALVVQGGPPHPYGGGLSGDVSTQPRCDQFPDGRYEPCRRGAPAYRAHILRAVDLLASLLHA